MGWLELNEASTFVPLIDIGGQRTRTLFPATMQSPGIAVTIKLTIMNQKALSIRPFIGAKDFAVSRSFYQDLGFQESIISDHLSYFKTQGLGFYLQDAYVKDWVDNTMVFWEVEDVEQYWSELLALDLSSKYKNARLPPIRKYEWGKECFLHDPSGILWHFGEFSR